MIQLDSVYSKDFWCGIDDRAARFLYDLLAERDETMNISHKEMPTYNQHLEFMDNVPYKYWYLIRPQGGGPFLGSIYLTRKNEIGIFIAKKFQRRGYARAAIIKLIRKGSERRFLANINPQNRPSIMLFLSLGFQPLDEQPIEGQRTFELEVPALSTNADFWSSSGKGSISGAIESKALRDRWVDIMVGSSA